MNSLVKYHSLQDVGSTNTYLHDLKGGDAAFPYELATVDFQSAGRGQRGNTWESERGKNLLFSILSHPVYVEVKDQFLVSEAIALAVLKGVRTVAGDAKASDFSVKWPNDIYWKSKKLAGILIENDLQGTHLMDSIVGVGLNVNQRVFLSDAPNPVSLYNILGRDSDRDSLLEMIVDDFVSRMESLKSGDASLMEQEYYTCMFRREGYHRYKDIEGEFCARIDHVRRDGHIVLVDDSGRQRQYEFKEVSIIL